MGDKMKRIWSLISVSTIIIFMSPEPVKEKKKKNLLDKAPCKTENGTWAAKETCQDQAGYAAT